MLAVTLSFLFGFLELSRRNCFSYNQAFGVHMRMKYQTRAASLLGWNTIGSRRGMSSQLIYWVEVAMSRL